MNPETLQFVKQLADKLGTTAEHVYSVLVAQAPVEAQIHSAIAIACGILFVLGFLLVVWGIFQKDSELGGVVAFVGGIVMIVTLIIGSGAAMDAYRISKNPEYWAIKEIINFRK